MSDDIASPPEQVPDQKSSSAPVTNSPYPVGGLATAMRTQYRNTTQINLAGIFSLKKGAEKLTKLTKLTKLEVLKWDAAEL